VFKNLSYKKKNQLLIAGLVVTIFLIYLFALKKTIRVYHEYNDMQNKIEMVESVPMMTAVFEKQLLQMNSRIASDTMNGQRIQQALLELLSNYCKNSKAVLREFPQSTDFEQGDLLVETNLFVIESDFKTLLKLVYILEQKKTLGKIASIHYQYKKDLITRNMALTATVYLQNIKKNKKETTLN